MQVRGFVEREGLKYPMVLGDEGKGDLRVVMGREELEGCGGDAKALVERLREKGGWVQRRRRRCSKLVLDSVLVLLLASPWEGRLIMCA